MPLIIMVGCPSSGKSSRSQELKEFFETSKGKVVHIVSENEIIKNSEISKNEVYENSSKEKMIRADLKSNSLRKLNKNDLVIIDGGNYIKGYRYEIYCASKSARSTQCTIHCAVTREKSWEFNENRKDKNEVYVRDIFDALWMRFEEPISTNRWDSPLFAVTPDDQLPFEDIYNAIYEKKPPSANQSTQNPPTQSTNYLFELDRITQDIVTEITAARKLGSIGSVKVKDSTETVSISSDINASQLNRMRRQYLNYSKQHLDTAGDLVKAPTLFVQYLNTVLSDL
ncbi:CLUMA_CG003781, isoform A [Clunio marinus]|uniref:Protein KTI12 homolog n=1 Tax=Clunio marinus TaxID=568069 RepID=A0A1J1HU88_9DIPT|nr:CLUMA_CG003781, isoform A [Clunio marinus]